jgi:hypothetical protein
MLEKPRYRGKGKIKVDLKWGVRMLDWSNLAQYSVLWQALVNTNELLLLWHTVLIV